MIVSPNLFKHLKQLLAGLVILVLIVPPLLFNDPTWYQQLGVAGFILSAFGLGTLVAVPLFFESFSIPFLVLTATLVTVSSNYLGWWAGQTSRQAQPLPAWLLQLKPFLEKYGKPGLFVLCLLPLPNALFALPGYTNMSQLTTWDFLVINGASKLVRHLVLVTILLLI